MKQQLIIQLRYSQIAFAARVFIYTYAHCVLTENTQHDCSLTSTRLRTKGSVCNLQTSLRPCGNRAARTKDEQIAHTLALYASMWEARRAARHESICGVKMFDKRPPLRHHHYVVVSRVCIVERTPQPPRA
jgi:hypothetical protein